MFKKEVEILFLLGVLEVATDSEWGASYYEQPKPKTKRVRFLSDFRNLNKIKVKIISYTKYQPDVIEIRRFSLCYITRFKYGILSYPNKQERK